MTAQPIAIKGTGLVTSVGLSAPAACAAIRAKVSNPTETRFMGSDGEWIMAHQVPLEQPWRGRTKLAKMAAMAIAECLDEVPRETWPSIPLLLCVAERERPGRLDGLDDRLLPDIEQELELHFATCSAIVAQGRVGIAIAIGEARKLLSQGLASQVLIASADSLLNWGTLSAHGYQDRLLTSQSSNGFRPGEAAGAILLGFPSAQPSLLCTGIGFGLEQAHIHSEEPLRAEGLARAIGDALREAERHFQDLDFRIADMSGEQYYFKEATLALGRILRTPKKAFDIWHPAECTGETGAAAGFTMLAVAETACRKAYGSGPNILVHLSNDDGQRAAAIVEYRGSK